MRDLHAKIVTLAAIISLSGCASTEGRYPTLEIREAERITGTFMPETQSDLPTTPSAMSGSKLEQIIQIETSADAIHAQFTSAAPRTSQIVRSAAGAAIASDQWASAQIALGDLDSLRSQTAVALGDLDLLFVDATLAFEQRQAIAEVREKVLAMVTEEDLVLAKLRGSMAN